MLDRRALERITHEVDVEIHEATERALKAPPPPRGTAFEFLYSAKVDPTSSAFGTEPRFEGEPRTMVDAINRTLREEMARNEMVVVFGEDVADCSREANLAEVKGKGGVFKATAGLQTGVRIGAVLQHAARGGGHRRTRHRNGDARAEAGGGDPVLRLHLARDDAVARRVADHPLAIE